MAGTDGDASNAVSTQAPKQRFRHSRRLGWARALLLNITLITIPLLVYFAIVVKHAASYNDERSLRALQEVATQVDNRVETMRSILAFAPGQLRSVSGPSMVTPGPKGWKTSADQRKKESDLKETIRVMPKAPGVGLEFLEPCATSNKCTRDQRDIDSLCSDEPKEGSNYWMTIAIGPATGINMVNCKVQERIGFIRDGEERKVRGRVTTTIPQVIENTQALAEMPVILVASVRGEVYAQLARNHATDIMPPAQQEVREEPGVVNVRELLAAANKVVVSDLQKKNELGVTGESKGEGTVVYGCCGKKADGGESEAALLALPVALDTRVAGVPYRAYILPYTTRDHLCTLQSLREKESSKATKCPSSDGTIYFIGLRPGGILSNAGSSFSPGVILGALFVVALAFLLWPFLRYMLFEPNDAVPWWQIRLIAMAFIGISLLGVIAARSLEMSYGMHAKMSAALQVVAAQIDQRLRERVKAEFKVLQSLESESLGEGGAIPCGRQGDDQPKKFPAIISRTNSSVDTFFRTNAAGRIKEGSHSFDAKLGSWYSVCTDGDVHLREYFSLLKRGRGAPLSGVTDQSIALQRLFNKPDGKKILQLAIPTSRDGSPFSGISSVNIGSIEITNPVLPFEMGYVIFDRSTGTVVFHSDDSRSLIENFYAETERDSSLEAAAKEDGSRGMRLDGRYRGVDSTFFYQPMSYSPWGLAVYYRTGAVSAITAIAVVSAIAGTISVLMIGLLMAHAITWYMCRYRSWLWPQWRLRDAYIAVSLYLAVVAICEFPILRDAKGGGWQLAVFLTGPLFAASSCIMALGARTVEFAIRRPRSWRFGMSLLWWCVIVHAVVCAIWVCAACVAGKWPSGIGLVASWVAWYFVVWTAKRPAENPNAWRREVVILRGGLARTTTSGSYRIRYVMFAMVVSMTVAAAPALAIFDRTFEWYLSSALDLSRSSMTRQDIAHDQKAAEDRRELGNSVLQATKNATDPWLFGVKRFGGVSLDADGSALFGDVGEEVACQPPAVAPPIGLVESQLTFGNSSLERLRQAAMSLRKRADAGKAGHTGGGVCGVGGTIRYLLSSPHRGLVVLCDAVLAGIIIALLVFLLSFIARRVMGIAWPWSGRSGRQKLVRANDGEDCRVETPERPARILLLQPDARSLDSVRKRMGSPVVDIDLASDDVFALDPRANESASWLLLRLEVAILDETRRIRILRLLETRVAHASGHVVLIGDVSPVYRIARPHAYPGPVWPNITDNERLRWIDLFARFRKTYSMEDPRAISGTHLDSDARLSDFSGPDGLIQEFICREARALWPCLEATRNELLARVRSGERLTDREVVEVFALHGEVHYRRAWEYCTREERLALYHLANGKLINMMNHRVLEHLLRRGLIVFEPQPRIKSASLADFVLNAELPGRMEAWSAEAAEGVWQSLRTPLFIVLMLAVAWIAYVAGDAFKALVAVLTTSVAMAGQALRLLGVSGLPGSAKEK